MILYNGNIYDTSRQDELILSLPEDLRRTLGKCTYPDVDTVIHACDTLASRVKAGSYDDIVKPFLEKFGVSEDYFNELCDMFTEEGLRYKVSIELGDREEVIAGRFTRRRYPLGVLFHIAAGNFDVLPAYSVVEGLLSGNINILKLPMGDSGISVKLLSDLIQIAPSLKEFIYVFDVPSTETESIKKLADLADGIAVWGGDMAVSAARKLAGLNTKIISWGHKLSFAYCEEDASDEQLNELAKHICITNQTLCSSCQGIFVDTEDDEVLLRFAKRFFEVLKEVNKNSPPCDYGMRAKNAINIYNERLEGESTIFDADGISVIVRPGSDLQLSYMYRSVWVKKLPMDKIYTLHDNKNYLQTASVLTTDAGKKRQINDKLAYAGLVRITGPGTMSRMVPGEAHDGTYALREYSGIVETDNEER